MPWVITPKPRRLSGLRRWRSVNRERILAWSAGSAGLVLMLAVWGAVALWAA